MKLGLRLLLLEGRYFWRDCYFWDLLTPVTFYRYFRGVVTFGTLRYYTPCIQGVCCSSDAGI